jgi:hypothetical protein
MRASYLVCFSAMAITAMGRGATTAAPMVTAVAAPSIPTPLLRPLPLHVAVCYPAALRDARVVKTAHGAQLATAAESPTGSAPVWQLGPASTATLDVALHAAFASVEPVEVCRIDGSSAGHAQLMLVPQLVGVAVDIPSFRSVYGHFSDHPTSANPALVDDVYTRHCRVTFELTFSASTAQAPLVWRVEGTLVTPHSAGDSYDIAMALSAALRDACAQLLADITGNVELRAWLATAAGTATGAWP